MVVRKNSRIYEFADILLLLTFGRQFELQFQEQYHLVLFLESIRQFLFAQLVVQFLAI
jgi:hypothetical protein